MRIAKQKEKSKDFFILAQHFIIDLPELRLEANFIVMARSIELKSSFKIEKGKSHHKGFVRIFS